MKIGPSYLPPEFFSMDGIWYHNEGVCDMLYSGVGELGVIYARTNLLSTTSTKLFDQNNSAVALQDSTNKFYNSYWQLTAERKKTSKGTLDSTVYNYLYTDGNSVASSAITNNLFEISDKSYRFTNGGTQLQKTRANFAVQSNGLILPDSLFIQKASEAEQLDQVVTGYDANGEITEINKYGFYSSFIRDYSNQFVVAAVSNARSTDIAYTSFEANGTNGWAFDNANVSTGSSGGAVTGDKYYTIPANDFMGSSIGLNSSTTYIVSFWCKEGTPSLVKITGTPPNQNYSSTGSLIASYTNDATGWTYREYQVSNVSNLKIDNGGLLAANGVTYSPIKIDELRLYPKGALMTTYTYKPLIGVSSQSDASGHISYYSYDSFGRLQAIKDQNQNILKKYDYKYASQQ
jgi:YD repeat-containing protein